MTLTGDNGSAAISVRGIEKSFGDVRALCGVDLDAQTGTVLGLRASPTSTS